MVSGHVLRVVVGDLTGFNRVKMFVQSIQNEIIIHSWGDK